MASAFGFYDAQPRPCHPERSNYFAASCEMLRSRTRPKGGRAQRGIYGRNAPSLVDPQNACSVLTFKNQQFVADF